MAKKVIIAVVAGLAAHAAAASDYPTGEVEQDKLCEAMGETTNIAMPPRDRVWFTDNCICMPVAGCGKIASKRYTDRLNAATSALQAERKAAEQREAQAKAAAEKRRAQSAAGAKREAARIVKARKVTAGVRAEYWACSERERQESEAAPALRRQLEERSGACFTEGRQFFDDCYKSREGDARYLCEGETKRKRDACLQEVASAERSFPRTECTNAATALEAACEKHGIPNEPEGVRDNDCYRNDDAQASR